MINFAVPSGGGHWVVPRPLAMPAAQAPGADVADSRLGSGITGLHRQSCKRERMKEVVKMDIVDMARTSGMTVILDGRIGREEYQSVCGSLSALQRFADAVRHAEANRKGNRNRVRPAMYRT